METRQFHDKKVSLLGFGCMRLPLLTADDHKSIDMATFQKLVDYAYEQGVNYYDTAYIYHEGLSEPSIGKALQKYPRESYFLANKMPGWLLKDGLTAEQVFEEQRKRCQVDYFDFYLCHAIGKSPTDFEDHLLNNGSFEYLLQQKKAGRIRHLGFSFHGNVERFKVLLGRHDWDFVQIQLNYLDWRLQDAKTLYALLEEKNIPCVVMEPVRGGNLCHISDEVTQMLEEAAPGMSTASWAIRFVASLPNVLTVLSGMNVMAHVKDNIQTVKDFTPLNATEKELLAHIADIFMASGNIPCTACRYCMDCPTGVDIPEVFTAYNQAAAAMALPVDIPIQRVYNKDTHKFLAAYAGIAPENRAHQCIMCGQCAENCPQGIAIPEEMRRIAKIISEIKPELGEA